MAKILELFKGKYRVAAWTTLIIVAVIIMFAVGLTIGWAIGNVRSGPRPTVYSFTTVYTGEEDFRLVQVDVHISSKEAASLLRDVYYVDLNRELRRELDKFFRLPGGRVKASGEGLSIDPYILENIIKVFEETIVKTDREMKKGDEQLVLAVTIYFDPDEL